MVPVQLHIYSTIRRAFLDLLLKGDQNTASPISLVVVKSIAILLSHNINFSPEKMEDETYCQLCGVSFAIARLRRADEPPEAAWSRYGDEYVTWGDFFAGPGSYDPCESSGCQRSETHTGDDEQHEHIAGPGCMGVYEYNGHRISLEEMRGSRAARGLAKKTSDWNSEQDDQDFEIGSNYFLTGINQSSSSPEWPLENLQPIRHGISKIRSSNTDGVVSFTLPIIRAAERLLLIRCF